MFTNFDCDCFYVADRATLIRTLSVLPDAGHIFITDQTDRSCEAVLAFLAEC